MGMDRANHSEDMVHALSASLSIWRFVFVRNLAVSKWSDLIILLPAVTFSRSKLTNSSHTPDQNIKQNSSHTNPIPANLFTQMTKRGHSLWNENFEITLNQLIKTSQLKKWLYKETDFQKGKITVPSWFGRALIWRRLHVISTVLRQKDTGSHSSSTRSNHYYSQHNLHSRGGRHSFT